MTLAIPRPALGVPSAVGQVLALTGRTLVERWRSTMWWALGLVGMAVVQLSVYPSVAQSAESMQAMVGQWPDAFKEMFALESYGTAAGFLNAEMFSLMVPLILIGVAVGGAAGATAGEEERGTADLLLALPITRTRVMVAKVLATVICVAAVAVAGMLTIVIGAPIVDLDIGPGFIAAATLMTALLALDFGAVSLVVGAATGRRAAALGVGVALALASFLLNALAPMADWLEPWQDASPFAWALRDDPLTTGVAAPMALALLVLAVALSGLALGLFHRRDVESR